MENKITFKDIISYSYLILRGRLTPFLKSEICESEINNLYQNLNEQLDNTDYCLELIRHLKRYYDSRKDIYLSNSGREALYLILLNLNLKKKEIIIPSYSCLGLIEPIIQLDFQPHFVDIDKHLNPSLESVEKAINSNTAAVVIPHLGGTFARDTFEIIELCRKKKIIVIEDCCQAFGLKYKKQKIGTFADISFYSSGVGKPIFTPCGGWIVTKKGYFKNFSIPNHTEIEIKRILKIYKKFANKYSANPLGILKNRLSDKLYSLVDDSVNSFPNLKKKYQTTKLSNFSAYFILKQLNTLDENILKRKNIAFSWIKKLKNNNKIEILNNTNSIYNKFFVSSEKSVKKKFLLSGLEVENGYVPLHLRYNLKEYKSQNLIHTNSKWKSIYSLPIRASFDIKLI